MERIVQEILLHPQGLGDLAKQEHLGAELVAGA